MKGLAKIIVFLLTFPAVAGAAEPQLLKEIVFPPNYDYAPDFDRTAIEAAFKDPDDVRPENIRLLLIGSGDAEDFSGEETLSARHRQLRRSESLRLALKRARWLREQLLAVGFERSQVQLGSVADSGTAWGGVVRIYAIQ